MKIINAEQVKKELANTTTEPELVLLVGSYLKRLLESLGSSIFLEIRNNIDLCFGPFLFEFKYDRNFRDKFLLMKTLAQALYYMRKRYEKKKPMPLYIILHNKFSVGIIAEKHLTAFYTNDKYDWNRSPTKNPGPDRNLIDDLIDDLEKQPIVLSMKITSEIEQFYMFIYEKLTEKSSSTKKAITVDNFVTVYQHWKERIGNQLSCNKVLLDRYFLQEIWKEQVYWNEDTEKLVFYIERNGVLIEEIYHVSASDYEVFWEIYERPVPFSETLKIFTKVSIIMNETIKKYTGTFPTPPIFCRLMTELLDATFPNWQTHPNVRLWDMCANNGNIEMYLDKIPKEHIYLSDINTTALVQAKTRYPEIPEANVFPYNYLRHDIHLVMSGADLLDENLGWKLPRKLREDLAAAKRGELFFIIPINPPFGETNSGSNQPAKINVNLTPIKLHMENSGMKFASQELYTQFLYRIKRELPNSILGLFATEKYITNPKYETFRQYFLCKFIAGFSFPAKAFDDIDAQFPINFYIWDLKSNLNIAHQNIILDKYNSKGASLNSRKTVRTITRTPSTSKRMDKPLNNVVRRPKGTLIRPNLTGYMTVDERNREGVQVCRDYIGYCLSVGNTLQSQYATIFSEPSDLGGGWSIIPENLELSAVIVAVRRAILANDYNRSSQLRQPNQPIDDIFKRDCLVWILVHCANQTSALKDVKYKGKIYQVRNQFFPLLIEDVKCWVEDNMLFSQMESDGDRFIANYLKRHIQLNNLSNEALNILDVIREIYKMYYQNYHRLDVVNYKLDYWDVGWRQIDSSLLKSNRARTEDNRVYQSLKNKLTVETKKMTDKLRTYIHRYKFL